MLLQCNVLVVGLIIRPVTRLFILKEVPLKYLPVFPVGNIFKLRKHGELILSLRFDVIENTAYTCILYFFLGLEFDLNLQVASADPEGHRFSQTYQLIVCFACPACYLLFNLRDECLQHMSAQNHFTESLAMSGKRFL